MRLLCCGSRNPLGVKQETLRFQVLWGNDERTEHFSIGIADSLEYLEKRIYNIGSWSEQFFDGNQLLLEQVLFEEGKVYYWHVVCGEDENEIVSDTASFEMGISEFQGQYVTAPRQSTYVKHFLKTFSTVENIRRARLYICGLGYFKWSLNGRTPDDSYYRPLVTDYTTRKNPDNTALRASTSHHVTYYTYDIKELLLEGENTLEVDVANGYYCNTDRLMCEMDYSFGPAQLAFEIHLETDSGVQIICSDTDTLVRAENYSSTLYVGDRVDFTAEPGEYEHSVPGDKPDGTLVSPMCEDDALQQEILPVNQWEHDGKLIYDFGMNHTGGLKLQVQAEEGDVLHIRYAEVLDDDGTPNYETGAWHDRHPKTGEAGDIYQENIYVLKSGCNVIEPLFSWFCYRYAVLDMPETTSVQSISSSFIHMDVACDGEFTCSEPLLMKINDTFRQTLRCNMHSGLITDCPHREKRPYTGDGHLVMKAAWYNYDVESFYYKWLQDLLDAQNPDGRIPNTAPDLAGGGGYGWGNAICFVTKQLYQFTGDTKVLARGYPAIKKWLAFYAAHCDEDSIVRTNDHNWMLGDWLAPEIVTSNTYYINTVCYLTDLWAVANKAKECGDNATVNFCIQTYNEKGNAELRVPETRADISFQTNVGLALGAQSFEYFEYYDWSADDDITGILTNGLYDEVKSVNRELLAWDHVFMAFDWQGIKTYQVGEDYTKGISQLSNLEKVIVSASAETVVGEYKYTNGSDTDYGYMITNFTDPSKNITDSVNIEVNPGQQVLVYRNGVGTYMSPDGNDKINFKLGAGEGVFVIVD